VDKSITRLGFDIDGVIYPWHEIVLEAAKAEGLLEISTQAGDLFGYPEEEGLMFSWSKFTRDRLVATPEFYMQPLPRRSKDVLDKLSEHYELFYVTARTGELEYPTFRWAQENDLPQRKNLFVSNGPKADFIVDHEIEVFIEDRPKYVDELAPYCTMVLLSQPWNTNYTKKNHVRVDHLEELLPLFGVEDERS
jgi:uncharacterized HAD superfamily protein